MFTRINRAMKDRDMGFTLIELLVVIIIIGILAGIAIPVFLSQRKRAYDSSVKSDVSNAAIALESYAAGNNGTYPTANPSTDPIKFTAGNTLKVYVSGTQFCVTGSSANSQAYTTANPAVYDSANGGLSSTGTCSIATTTPVFTVGP